MVPQPKPSFQFCDMWIRDPSFLPLVTSIKASLSSTDPITNLKRFLKIARLALHKLNKTKYADLKSQLSRARADLEGIQWLLSHNVGDQEALQKIDMTRAHYLHILSLIIDIIRQESKAEWIGYGDDSTRYFFAKIKKRKIDTYILSIQDDHEHTRQGFTEVKEVMHTYYKALLGKQFLNRSQIDPQVIGMGHILTVEQQLKLCAPFTDQEIKTVMFSIPNIKSPGLDGFSSGFFKATWHLIRGMVKAAILNFFHIGIMPSFLGETKPVLIPKTPNPTHAKEFKPISYCNVIYKCIAKLLRLRLKEVLAHLIHQNEGALIKGRELLFNILMCQDIARGYTRKGISPRCIMKIDLQKPFDSIHWDFLNDLLYHLKFHPQFITWVMVCITSIIYRVHVNGM